MRQTANDSIRERMCFEKLKFGENFQIRITESNSCPSKGGGVLGHPSPWKERMDVLNDSPPLPIEIADGDTNQNRHNPVELENDGHDTGRSHPSYDAHPQVAPLPAGWLAPGPVVEPLRHKGGKDGKGEGNKGANQCTPSADETFLVSQKSQHLNGYPKHYPEGHPEGQ